MRCMNPSVPGTAQSVSYTHLDVYKRQRIGEVMAYEMSKTFAYSVKEIQTPLGIAPVRTPDNPLVISTILRAGLPFHQGFLSYFDYAENAFVSAYRKYKDTLKFDIHTVSYTHLLFC